MKSMKLEDKEIDNCEPCMVSDKQEYPYGLKLQLEHESVEKLGLSKIPEVGSYVIIMARAYVCNTHEMEHGDKIKKSFGLQITDMDLKPAKAPIDEKKIYDHKEENGEY